MPSSFSAMKQRLQTALHIPTANSMDNTASEEPKATDSDEDVLPAIDKKKERQLVRKLDRYIVPVVMLLYLMSFLDRYGYSSCVR